MFCIALNDQLSDYLNMIMSQIQYNCRSQTQVCSASEQHAARNKIYILIHIYIFVNIYTYKTQQMQIKKTHAKENAALTSEHNGSAPNL